MTNLWFGAGVLDFYTPESRACTGASEESVKSGYSEYVVTKDIGEDMMHLSCETTCEREDLCIVVFGSVEDLRERL